MIFQFPFQNNNLHFRHFYFLCKLAILYDIIISHTFFFFCPFFTLILECVGWISDGNLISHMSRSNCLFCSWFFHGSCQCKKIEVSFFFSFFFFYLFRRIGGWGNQKQCVLWTNTQPFQRRICVTRALAFHYSSWKGTEHLLGIYI